MRWFGWNRSANGSTHSRPADTGTFVQPSDECSDSQAAQLRRVDDLHPRSILLTGYTAPSFLGLLLIVSVVLAAPPLLVGSSYERPITLIDAVGETLDNHLDLQIQQQEIEISRAVRQHASSAFDTNLSVGGTHGRTIVPLTSMRRLGLDRQGVGQGSIVSNRTRMSVSTSKLFRAGMTVTPYLTNERVSGLRIDPVTGNVDDRGGTTFSHTGIEISFPLLRGRGKKNVTAGEVSAGLDLDATTLDRLHLMVTLITGTVTRYWEHAARLQIQQIYEQSEGRGSVIAGNVQLLIDADREPASSYHNAAANLAQRTAARIEADQETVAANQRLTVALGTRLDGIGIGYSPTDSLPLPVDTDDQTGDFKSLDQIVSESLERRPDYQAATTRVQSARVESAASFNLLRPRLDLSVSAGYSGLSEGRSVLRSLAAPISNVRGADVVAGLLYEFPRANNLARSRVLQARSQQTSRELEAQHLSRLVGSEIVIAIKALENAVRRLEKARGAVTAFTRALESEREKLGLGIGSIVDLLTVEDRLTGASQMVVEAQLAYALALVNLRFATGTLLPKDDPKIVLTFEDVASIPEQILEEAK